MTGSGSRRRSVAELAAQCEREERALADARASVVRLETALAQAAHQRDRQEEAARLASDGVVVLEQRLQAREREMGRERVEAQRRQAELEREGETRLAEAARQHERELARAERDLAVARAQLEDREAELARAQAAGGEAQRDLAAARERLAEIERELAVRERELAEIERELAMRDRDLAARIRELGAAGEELIARESELAARESELAALETELDGVRDLLATREAELRAASALLEAQGTELGEARDRLEVREGHLETAQLGIESRDRKLEAADRAQRAREAELERLRAASRRGERRLALVEARLEKAQQRSERFRASLVELRGSTAYRLMRFLWRLRRPFRRAPREALEPGPAEPDGEGARDPAPEPPPPVAIARREPPPRRQNGRLRVAAILDAMSAACFAPECDLVSLTLEGWREQLDERRPDLLLVESAWNGNDGEWQYRIAKYPRKDLVGLPALRALLDGCRERGIPTVFWNKEDPVHFDRFAEAAALFDHVFTTDAGCVERYRALPGERTVAALPFAAQPRIHNPAAIVEERSSSPCFAGAWYRDRHADRRRSLEALLDAARPFGLVIYDRRFGADDPAFGFPERFQPHVLGRLPYERILDVYKAHHVFLNANSVVDSPTMCSRRVFELAACDTAIVSTPGAAIAALLGEGVVDEAADEQTAAAALACLLGDEPERRRRTRAARRKVFAEHTYAERLATIAATAGLNAPSRNGDGWELIVQPGVELSDGARADLRAASIFADADAIGVHPGNGTRPIEHRPVEDLDPRALLVRRELLEARGWPSGSPEQVQARLRQWSADGVRLYAADADLLAAPTPWPTSSA